VRQAEVEQDEEEQLREWHEERDERRRERHNHEDEQLDAGDNGSDFSRPNRLSRLGSIIMCRKRSSSDSTT